MRFQWVSCELPIKSLNSLCVRCHGIHKRFYGRGTHVDITISCLCFRIFDRGKTELSTQRKWGHLHVWFNWFHFSNIRMNYWLTNPLKAYQELWTLKTSNMNKCKCQHSLTYNVHSFTEILFWKSTCWLSNHSKCKSNQ